MGTIFEKEQRHVYVKKLNQIKLNFKNRERNELGPVPEWNCQEFGDVS